MMWLAMGLTVARLLSIPVLFVLARAGQRNWFVALFLFAGLTDVLDGWAARRFKTVSRAGAFLDSIADYLLFGGVIVWLYWFEPKFVMENVLLVSIVVVVAVVKELVKWSRGSGASHWWPSKATSVVLSAFVVFTVLVGPVRMVWFVVVGVLLLLTLAEVRIMTRLRR